MVRKSSKEPSPKNPVIEKTLCGSCGKKIADTEIDRHLESHEHKDNRKRKETNLRNCN